MGSIAENVESPYPAPSTRRSNKLGGLSPRSPQTEVKSKDLVTETSPSKLNQISAMMQGGNISIQDTNQSPRYNCHIGRLDVCEHKHSYNRIVNGQVVKNRHTCPDCEESNNAMSHSFRALKPKFPKAFQLKDLAIYSAGLKYRDTKKYDELKPILLAEGRRPPPTKKTRGIMAGEDDFSDDEEYK